MNSIKDVAKLAGVAVGTVSKYINGGINIKEKNRIKIEDAIKKLRYTPSTIAQSMRTQRTNMIAIVEPYITNPFFAEVFNSIRINALKEGLTTILYTTDDDLPTLEKYIKNMSPKNLDGIALVFLDDNEMFEKLLESTYHIPSVIVSWDKRNPSSYSIIVDVHQGMYDITGHLISKGKKRFGYISGPLESKISQDKFNGFMAALSKNKILFDRTFLAECTYNVSSGYQCTQKLIRDSSNIDAIVCANDIIAVGCLKSLTSNSIKVPDDIAVSGFDNIPLSLNCTPTLTTVALPFREIGIHSVSILKKAINNTKGIVRVVLPTKIVVRDSS